MSLVADHLPLVRWDGVHLVLHLRPVEEHLRRVLEHPGVFEDVRLAGSGDTLRVEAAMTWRGARAQLVVELAEIRLRSRHLGLRVRRVLAAGIVRVPRRAVLAALRSRFPTRMTTFPGDGIVVFDVGQWLPAELSLRILTVQVTGEFLHLWVGAGSLQDLPGSRQRTLAANAGGGTDLRDC